MLDIQAMSPQEALAQDRREDWGQGVFLVLLATPLLWAVLQWWHQRERVLGAFALKQTVTLAWVLLLYGYDPGLPFGLAPAVLDQLTSVLVLAAVARSVWFDRALLSGCQVPRWGPRAAGRGCAGTAGAGGTVLGACPCRAGREHHGRARCR